MANVPSIFGFNPSVGTTLLALYGSDIVNVNTGLGYGQNIFSTNVPSWEAFLDKAWFVNRSDKPRYFDGVTWTSTGKALRFPNASLIKLYRPKARLFLGDIVLLGTRHMSRIWYSDLPSFDTLTWGYETGNNLQQSSGSNVVIAPGALFITNNIRVGNPIVIADGPNDGQYLVSSIVSETQLTLTTSLPSSKPASNYWVGGNWLDVATDDNDAITGFGENSDRLLIFKRDSLHRYDLTNLRQIKGVPGTTSGRSIVNVRDKTIYFHRSGIWQTDGVSAELISRKLQPYIDGITTTNYDQVIAWRVGEDIYRVFVGNIANADQGISIDNCFFDFDINMQTASVGSYPFAITSTSTFIESQARNVYLGTAVDSVQRDNTSNADDGTTAIELRAETAWHFPFGPLISGIMTRVQIYVKDGRGISIKYKLLGIPVEGGETYSKEWISLGEVKNYITELKFDKTNPTFGRAIKFLIAESSTNKQPVVEKIIVYGIPQTERNIEAG